MALHSVRNGTLRSKRCPENFTIKEDDQRLLTHTSLRMGLTQTIFNDDLE